MTGERFRILVTDDSPDNLAIITAALRDPAHEIIVATSGEEALRIAASMQLDLVLLDVRMPGLDGIETCRRLKSDPALASVPVMFLSGLDREENRLACLAAGAVDVIVKPFHPDDLIARARAQLDAGRARPTSTT